VAGSRQVLCGRNQFSVVKGGKKVADLALKSFGQYNTLNALAAFALATEMGWSLRGVMQGLADFKGVKRRQEVIYDEGGITVVEDFAHHPTAVGLTVQCMGEAYAGRRIRAVFEPRSATSRRKVFQKDYVEALKKADEVFIAKEYDQSKTKQDDRFVAAQLTEDLKARGVSARACASVEEIVEALVAEKKVGDVIVIMSNGGFDDIYSKLLSNLRS